MLFQIVREIMILLINNIMKKLNVEGIFQFQCSILIGRRDSHVTRSGPLAFRTK